MALYEGKIAEMRTGEGKTLTATLPLYLHALAGKGAHLVTTNDFLVRWQAEWMGRVYEFLGLSIGHIQHDMGPEVRQEMYRCDITYVQNSELGFDYLRDNMAVQLEHLVLPELNYAIVDEVDSILVDEARVPLIISGVPEVGTVPLEQIYPLVARLDWMDESRFIEDFQMKQGRRPSDEEKRAAGEEHEGVFDIKLHTCHLTERGMSRLERDLGLADLESPENAEVNHVVQACAKARTLFRNDKEYVVKDAEVVIVDEFTGHLQPGRRYSDGLHQAIEAKEGVKIDVERQTVATITYQNFFRLYKRLAGMTGTAKTEEAEFQRIYNMPVLVVPTNRPCVRRDHPDVVYKTQEAKYRGIVAEIVGCQVHQQPVLVGTRNVEVSELISERLDLDRLQLLALTAIVQVALQRDKSLDREQRERWMELLRRPLPELNRNHVRPVARALNVDMKTTSDENLEVLVDLWRLADGGPQDLDRAEVRERLRAVLEAEGGIAHEVLNAKQHEREGQIIAQAGRVSAVTVATNMAGRGVDIMLGGRPEVEGEVSPDYEPVKERGGLHILGTERHESRRIDNQLRGRSGRQGDPGSSRFYVSLEDELMRLFAPERMKFLMGGWPDEEPLEHGIVSRSIERAQHKVEMRNFDMRKRTLQFDDVMNEQRTVIYGERRRVLERENLRETTMAMVDRTVRNVLGSQGAAEGRRRELDSLMADAVRRLLGTEPATEERVVESLRRDLGRVLRRVDMSELSGDLLETGEPEEIAGALRQLYREQEEESEGGLAPLPDDLEAQVTDLVAKHTKPIPDPLGRWAAEAQEKLAALVPGLDTSRLTVEHLTTTDHMALTAELSELAEQAWARSVLQAVEEPVPGIAQHVDLAAIRTSRAEELAEVCTAAAARLYEQREAQMSPELVREIERYVMLRVIDSRWMQHLQEMDYLREAVYLRAYGQKDPLVEYQREGYEYFQRLLDSIASDVTAYMFRVEEAKEQRGPALRDMHETSEMEAAAEESRGRQPTVKVKTPRRNDPCPCGSGKKYKNCCMP